jgi:hypothetical protein
MGLEDQPQIPKKTVVSRVQEKVQGFRWVMKYSWPNVVHNFYKYAILE